MTTGQLITAAAAFVLFDLCIVPIIMFSVINSSWGELEKQFPGREPAPGAVRREFQSVAIDMSNFGGCAHITVDEACLHLQPAKFLRWFKAGPISIPWDRVAKVETKRSKTYAQARVGGKKLTAPRWALELAGSEGTAV